MLQLMHGGCSYIYPPLSIARYSFIQLNELERYRVKKLAQCFKIAAQDSNPGPLSRESEAVILSHCALQSYLIQFVYTFFSLLFCPSATHTLQWWQILDTPGGVGGVPQSPGVGGVPQSSGVGGWQPQFRPYSITGYTKIYCTNLAVYNCHVWLVSSGVCRPILLIGDVRGCLFASSTFIYISWRIREKATHLSLPGLNESKVTLLSTCHISCHFISWLVLCQSSCKSLWNIVSPCGTL